METTGVLLLLIAALLLLLSQLGFALRELGAVRPGEGEAHVGAKLAALFVVSVLAYTFIGHRIAYGTSALAALIAMAEPPSQVPVFLALSAGVAAIVAGAIAERARFWPQLLIAACVAGLLYPLLEYTVWAGRANVQQLMVSSFGARFHDFGGAMLMHGFAGWLALVGVMVLGPRPGRFDPDGRAQPLASVNPQLTVLGIWLLTIAWFGISLLGSVRAPATAGLVAANALLAIAGGFVAALGVRWKTPALAHPGALTGLIAISAGADVIPAPAAFVVGAVAGALSSSATWACERHWRLDDVVGAWAVHGTAGVWGALACGIFGQAALGGQGKVSVVAQALGALGVVGVAIVAGFIIFGGLERGGVLRQR